MKKNILKKTCVAIAALCTLSTAAISMNISADNTVTETRSDSIYGIGSVSKSYAATAAMQLADKGLIDIDAPVTDYVPDFEMADPRYKDITVRMLMNHTSGLMGTSWADALLIEDDDSVGQDNLLENLRNQRLKADPGAFAAYCNDGFSLLQIVVERVSGMDFTDYVTKNIAAPLQCTQTGSFKNMAFDENRVKIYDKYNHPYPSECCSFIGCGGITSTAVDVATFGSAFFKGNNILLSESAKEEMIKGEGSDKNETKYGLGWDNVNVYGDDIKVITKGGDIMTQHASLLIAPDQKISVAVLSAGGSSALDNLLAQDLMNIALEEMGYDIKEKAEETFTVCDEVPEKYKEYEGLYTTGRSFMNVTFPDMKYLQIEITAGDNEKTEYYKYSSDGKFVKMLGDVPNGSNTQDRNKDILTFVERPDGLFIANDTVINFEKIGTMEDTSYNAERYVPSTASESAKAAWAARDGKYYLAEGKYSSIMFTRNDAGLKINFTDFDDGCVEIGGELFKVEDETHLKSFINVPGDTSRDLMDISVVTENGKERLYHEQNICRYIPEEEIPDLTKDIEEVKFEGSRGVQWYNIRKDFDADFITLDRTSKTTVSIFDKYDNCIYNTYSTGIGSEIPLPTEGKIVFIGESGESVKIGYVK